MQQLDVPVGCSWRKGRSAVLVVAPHGGRRLGPAAVALHPRKVNDLHTASLALKLAERLNGSLLVNTALDRNETDLNRISQVVQRAPWFLALLEHLLADILDRHAEAAVLFVHGWNVVQAKCDIGIGAVLDGEECAVDDAALTVTPCYLREQLRFFRQLCAAATVHTAYGERYPGSHPNNLIQLFRRRGTLRPGLPSRLAEWAERDRIQAVQLELGVPLRWPGASRDGFVDAAARAFSGAPAVLARSARRGSGHEARLSPATPAALQFYDPRSEIGLASSVTREPGGAASGRLLLLLGGQRIALFVGDEGRGSHLRGGPQFTPTEHGFRLVFDGVVLETEDGTLYIDLEHAFGASRLCRATVDLAYTATAGPTYGAVEGHIRLEQREWPIAAPGFAGSGVLSRAASGPASHAALSVSFAPTLGVNARTAASGLAGGSVTWLSATGPETQPLHALSVDLTDRYTPERLTLALAGADRLIAEPLSRASISRPLGRGRAVRLTFGTARVTWGGDRIGFGFYEYGRNVLPDAPTA